jgi:hypothetical protein
VPDYGQTVLGMPNIRHYAYNCDPTGWYETCISALGAVVKTKTRKALDMQILVLIAGVVIASLAVRTQAFAGISAAPTP